MADFYTYLSGTNGNNGKSAYELWKETVGTGNMNDPKNPGQKWPSDKVSEYDFFNYLAGKDGINGSNGLSAHELWKNDLAKFCGTTDALIDHKNGGVWDCEKNTLKDFYDYLHGKDGKDGEDGKDGKPGEPGKPGTEVTILRVYLMLLHNILNQNMVNMYAQLMEVYSIKYMMKLDKSHQKLK